MREKFDYHYVSNCDSQEEIDEEPTLEEISEFFDRLTHLVKNLSTR